MDSFSIASSVASLLPLSLDCCFVIGGVISEGEGKRGGICGLVGNR